MIDYKFALRHWPPARVVAQMFNLLYRRIVFGGAVASSKRLGTFHAMRITNPRYGRMQFCATRAGHACSLSCTSMCNDEEPLPSLPGWPSKQVLIREEQAAKIFHHPQGI